MNADVGNYYLDESAVLITKIWIVLIMIFAYYVKHYRLDYEGGEDVNGQHDLGRCFILRSESDQLKFISIRPVSFWDSYWAAPRQEPGLRVVSTCQVGCPEFFFKFCSYLPTSGAYR